MQEEKAMVEENNSKNKETMLSNTHLGAWPQKGQKTPKYLELLQRPSKENKWLMLKRPKLHSGFQGRSLYRQNSGGGIQGVDFPLVDWW